MEGCILPSWRIMQLPCWLFQGNYYPKALQRKDWSFRKSC